jgi:hypothetical protein
MTTSVISTLCAALLAVALSVPALAETAEPTAEDPGPLSMHDARMSFTATPLSDGSVLVVGGFDGTTAHASAELFDPTSRQFRRVGQLQTQRYGHTATALPDGRVLIAGGAGAGNPRGLSSVEVYDPATETFSSLGRLHVARAGHAAALLHDGRVLVTGGIGKGNRSRPLKSAEVFDPMAGASVPVDPMRKARMGHAAVPLEDGRVVIIGGSDLAGSGVQATEVYDPERQRFMRRSKLAGRANQPATARLVDGRVLVISEASFLLAPDAKSNERLEGLPRGGGPATATLLDDGRVVVIGKAAGGPATVDVFDPETDTTDPASPMRQPRHDHAAVRLVDGTVLVVGGIIADTACYQALATAEIWDPRQLRSVAGDVEVECVPWAEVAPPPLPPLGGESVGGRIVMPGSAFAVTVPEDWTVELADPDSDVFSAKPGTAWEALRATNPEGSRACSVAVGVAEVSLRKRSGTASNGTLAPMWHQRQQGTLMVPSPRVTETEVSVSSMSPMERLHRDHEGLRHDVLYSLNCAGVPERQFERIMFSLEFLPQP